MLAVAGRAGGHAIAVGRDEGRRDEALHTLRQLGLGALLEDAATRALLDFMLSPAADATKRKNGMEPP